MSNPRTQLAEALAILGTLAATAKAQQVELLQAASFGERTTPLFVSHNGDWVGGLGFSYEQGISPVRWHRSGTDLEVLAEPSLSSIGIAAITNGGSLFGTDRFDLGAWTSVGFQTIYPTNSAFGAVSGDGDHAVVFDWVDGLSGNSVYEGATRVNRLPNPPGSDPTQANGISADGTRVVGTTYTWTWVGNVSSTRYAPVRWINGHLVALSPGRGWSVHTSGISSDGVVIAGSTNEGFAFENRVPIIWIDGAEPMEIGPIGGTANRLSSDGRVVLISRSYLANEGGVWTPAGGYQTTEDYLISVGLGAEDARGVRIYDLSGEATVFAGTRMNGSGSRVPIRITLPSPCHLDYATDGMVDFFDYVAFVACFEGDCPNYRSADFNMDGFVDWADYAGFVEAFEFGC